MCFKNLLSKAFCAFAGAALIVAGCDKAQNPETNDDDQPSETVKHFTVTLTDITTTSCTVSIEKDDPDQLFYYEIVRGKSFEKLGNTFQERAKAYYDGEIDFWLNDMGCSKEEALGYITSKVDLEEYPREGLMGNTAYVLIVGYITPAGNPAGDFEYVEFKTSAPEASDNKLEVKVSDIEARSAHVSITASNSDQYTFLCFPASQFGNLAGAELVEELLYYNYWTTPTQNGSVEQDFEALKADTKYIVAAVGYMDHAATTELVTAEFTTGSAGDAGKWDYTVNFTDGSYKGYKVNAEIIPNDDTIDYCYEFIPVEYTKEEFTKQFYENLELMEQAGLDKESYISLFGAYGSHTAEDCTVKPGHSYRVAALPVDPKTGDFLEVIFSETIDVTVPEVSEGVSITVSCDKYYNGTDIAEVGGEPYESYRGYAVLKPQIKPVGTEDYRFGVFVDDGKEYAREDIIWSLLENGYMFPSEQILPFNRDAVIYAVAADENGVFGPVFTKKFKLSEDKAASAEEYFEQYSYSADNAAAGKAGAGETDSKKAAAEKIRNNWLNGTLRTFNVK